MESRYNAKNIVGSIGWKFLERGTSLLITFVVTIVLSRLLAPADFGLVAMVAVFVTISNIFVTSGVGNALIQKKNCDELDFSSMFWFNFVVALLLYFILFICSPYFALFYGNFKLSLMLQVLGLRLLVAAFNVIQCAQISKNMLFQFYFYSTLFGKFASGCVGIGMAIGEYGAWALIGQSLSQIVFETWILWIKVKWRPHIQFSWRSIQRLYSFTWKIMLMNLVEVFSDHVRTLLIGKKYTLQDLAYYDKGLLFPNTITTNVASSVSAVMFPVLANAQDEQGRSLVLCRHWTGLFAYCTLPLLTGLAVTATSLITVLLTEKWLPSVTYLQFACSVYATWIVEIPIRETIKSLGYAGACLRMQLLKTGFALLVLLAVMNYGVEAIAASAVGCGVFNMSVSAYYGNKILHYTPRMLLKDTCSSIFLNILMGVGVYAVSLLGLPPVICLLAQVVSGVVLYLTLSFLLKDVNFFYCKHILRGGSAQRAIRA